MNYHTFPLNQPIGNFLKIISQSWKIIKMNSTLAATIDSYLAAYTQNTNPKWILEYTEKSPYLLYKYSHEAPFVGVAFYLIMIYTLPKILKRPYKIKWVMAAWNLFLSVGSFLMLQGVIVDYIRRNMKYGVIEMLCDENAKHREPGAIIFWGYMFTLSKFLELFDTFFLILKNPSRPVSFLHWFHHATVLVVSWYGTLWRYSPSVYFMLINATVHCVMYFYYFLTELGYRPTWAKAVTIIQICQMIIGTGLNISWLYMTIYQKKRCLCDNWQLMTAMFVFIYVSYLILFVKFFVEKYILKTKKVKQQKAE